MASSSRKNKQKQKGKTRDAMIAAIFYTFPTDNNLAVVNKCNF
jgi:hypothetical protein